MRVLLDENFPLGLLGELRSIGLVSEHILESGRGVSDRTIRRRLEEEELLFLTQDDEFLSVSKACRATVLVSRVRQNRPIADRIRVWMRAVQEYSSRRLPQRVFEIDDDGRLLPWTTDEG